jgi:calcium-dependent protein kinase
MQKAMKVIFKKKVENPKQIIAEIESLKKLDHPNLVKLYEYYESKSKIFLVQELLEGEQLYNRLQDLEHFDETTARNIFR